MDDAKLLREIRKIVEEVVEEKLAPIRADIAELKTDVKELRTDVEILKLAVQQLKEEMEAVKVRLTNLEHRMDSLEHRMDSLVHQIDSLVQSLKEVKDDVSHLRSRIDDALNNSIKSLFDGLQQCDEQMKRFIDAANDIDKLKNRTLFLIADYNRRCLDKGEWASVIKEEPPEEGYMSDEEQSETLLSNTKMDIT